MTDSSAEPAPGEPGQAGPVSPLPTSVAPYQGAPAGAPQGGRDSALVPRGPGPLGAVRGTGMSVLLTIVTFGIYPIVWYYRVHSEIKVHTGDGLGGGLALLLAMLVGIVMPFLTASEVGRLYERRGQRPPVTGVTGLWVLLPLVGPIVWFVKTNGALNTYWRSLGAQG